jgi:uncharacterized protein with PIN domain
MIDCKQCGTSLVRVRRKMWMRFIPTSKRFRCDHCSGEYLRIIDRFVRIDKTPGKKTGLS